jgi:hypothetical protein
MATKYPECIGNYRHGCDCEYQFDCCFLAIANLEEEELSPPTEKSAPERDVNITKSLDKDPT